MFIKLTTSGLLFIRLRSIGSYGDGINQRSYGAARGIQRQHKLDVTGGHCQSAPSIR